MKEKCNNIFVSVESPRTDQEQVEALKGMLRLHAMFRLLLKSSLAKDNTHIKS